ncbi:MAG TPA: dihydroneopterin aldolase [Casimicrobiaceae bacterium]|nr:dihydroneopterin aldolase [Casimicrobiaceae bacterium]
MNTIFIHDFRVATKIGVYDWERKVTQTVRLDLDIGLLSDAAFRSGRFDDALDYAAVVERLRRFAAEHPYPLLERFAQAIADVVLSEFPAEWVKVRVAKPSAIAGVRELGVAIERHRGA